MKKYLNQQDMKDANCNNVLRLIRRRGAITRREIEAETGLSWGAVSNVTSRLIELGYIKERKNESNSAAGRTPILLEVSGEDHLAVGLDINYSGCRAVLVNLKNEVLCTVCRELGRSDKTALLETVTSLVREMLDFADGKHVLCIGVAMQGSVDAKNGILVKFPRCEDFENLPLAAYLEETFGIPAYLEHDPNCTLYAYSSPRKIKDAMLVRVDKGIGMAIMTDGKLFDRFGAFELGHTVAVAGGRPCACGGRGCLELYASMSGMAEDAGISFSELAAMAMANDAEAVARFTQMSSLLSFAIVNAAKLLNLEKIILCGAMFDCKDLFYDAFLANARALASDRELEFLLTDVSNAALGAAMIALDRATIYSE